MNVISDNAVKQRAYWVAELANISGQFGEDSAKVEAELTTEISQAGTQGLLDHLRLCGAIPEKYGHDSSEEKLYSKYTDALLAISLRHVGLTATVLTERADAADVEAVSPTYSLVGDAKAFRLSRTAKNQKDFKIEAMHGWKRGKPHAIVVCPIYQLPTRTSQIYQQSIARNVCIFTYSHLAVLVSYAEISNKERATELLLSILKCAEAMNPDKDAKAYWSNLNKTMLKFDDVIAQLWSAEKQATIESIKLSKEEGLTFLAVERERIMRMTQAEAIQELIANRNLDGRAAVIRNVADNGILSI